MPRPHLRLAGAALAAAFSAACQGEPPAALDTEDARNAYAVGRHLGQRLHEMGADVDADAVVAGFRDALDPHSRVAAAERQGLNEERIQAQLDDLAARTREQAARARAERAARNEEAARAFLDRNRDQPGVALLPDGGQYRIVAAGEGEPPAPRDRITVEYEGRLLDGTVFDTSRDRSVPTSLRLERALPAWQRVLPQVGAGGEVELWLLPSASATAAANGLVEPGELLHFRLRLVAIDRLSPLP